MSLEVRNLCLALIISFSGKNQQKFFSKSTRTMNINIFCSQIIFHHVCQLFLYCTNHNGTKLPSVVPVHNRPYFFSCYKIISDSFFSNYKLIWLLIGLGLGNTSYSVIWQLTRQCILKEIWRKKIYQNWAENRNNFFWVFCWIMTPLYCTLYLENCKI